MMMSITCSDCLMSCATSLFSGSLSRPMTKWSTPEVFLSTLAAYACVTPTSDLPSTSMIWAVIQWCREISRQQCQQLKLL